MPTNAYRFLPLVLATILACTQRQEAAPGRSPGEASDSLNLEWLFAPTEDERSSVSALLRDSVTLRAGLDLSHGRPQLHRFGPETSRRYLLKVFVSRTAQAPDVWGWSFLAVVGGDDGRLMLSSPYSFADEENLVVRRIEDLDGDGLSDVVYCAWFEAEGSPVVARAMGYRRARWYVISVRGSRVSCDREP